jgi:hypothetical protein
MDRRDFLRLRVEQRLRVAEISCARLYVLYCDYSVSGPERAALHDAETAALHDAETAGLHDAERAVQQAWEGEPPTELNLPTTDQLFASLDVELRSVDLVRVLDADWLASDDFRREFELVISRFCARGGRVEYQRAASPENKKALP